MQNDGVPGTCIVTAQNIRMMLQYSQRSTRDIYSGLKTADENRSAYFLSPYWLLNWIRLALPSQTMASWLFCGRFEVRLPPLALLLKFRGRPMTMTFWATAAVDPTPQSFHTKNRNGSYRTLNIESRAPREISNHEVKEAEKVFFAASAFHWGKAGGTALDRSLAMFCQNSSLKT